MDVSWKHRKAAQGGSTRRQGAKRAFLVVVAAAFVACSVGSENASTVKFDRETQQMLEFSSLRDKLSPGQIETICQQKTLIVFVGNKEPTGKFVWPENVNSSYKQHVETFLAENQKGLSEAIDRAEEGLRQAIASNNCRPEDGIGGVTLLSVIDGPGNDDSKITTQRADWEEGTWTKDDPVTWDYDDSELKQASSTSELFLPEDLTGIVRQASGLAHNETQLGSPVYDQIFYILKTHGGLYGADEANMDLLAENSLSPKHITLFDPHDGGGTQRLAPLVMPGWSDATQCELLDELAVMGDSATRERAGKRREKLCGDTQSFEQQVARVDDEGSSKSGTSKSGTSKSGTSKSGTSKSGTSKSGTSKSGTSKSGTSKSGTSKSGTSKSGTSKFGTSKSGTSKSGTSKFGTSKSGTSKSGTSKFGTSKSGTSKSGTSKSGTSARSPLLTVVEDLAKYRSFSDSRDEVTQTVPEAYFVSAEGASYEPKEKRLTGVHGLDLPSGTSQKAPVLLVLDSCFGAEYVDEALEVDEAPVASIFANDQLYYDLLDYGMLGVAEYTALSYLSVWAEKDRELAELANRISEKFSGRGFDVDPVLERRGLTRLQINEQFSRMQFPRLRVRAAP